MGRCEVCGNEYDKSFQVRLDSEGDSHVFDSFECAAYALAPRCARCGCRVLGHGAEQDGIVYCGAHCASLAGATELRDRA